MMAMAAAASPSLSRDMHSSVAKRSVCFFISDELDHSATDGIEYFRHGVMEGGTDDATTNCVVSEMSGGLLQLARQN